MEDNAPEVVIVVMGATGTGKSTFINLVSGSDFGVGEGLRSCTEVVQVAAPFNLDRRRVVLIDTPGFDDTARSDTDVLKMIAAFLATSYEQGHILAGVIYFHRISDFKMGGTSTRNFRMFRKLCGDSALQNAVIVTNMWGEVDARRGNAREAELVRDDMFFGPVLDKGVRIARHDNTCPSAEKIIRLILENHPLPLRIQEELVDEQKDISETAAGEELNRELNARISKYQQEVRAIREEMEQAVEDEDEEARMELEIESERMQREVARIQNDARRLESDYKKERERLKERLEQVGLEARREAERVPGQYQQQTDESENVLGSNAEEASVRERAQMPENNNELSWSALVGNVGSGGLGLFLFVGAIVGELFFTS